MIKNLGPNLYLNITIIGIVVYNYFNIGIFSLGNRLEAILRVGLLMMNLICFLIYLYKSHRVTTVFNVSDIEYRYWKILINSYLSCWILLIILPQNYMLVQHITLYSMTVILVCILIMQISLIKSGKYYFKKK